MRYRCSRTTSSDHKQNVDFNAAESACFEHLLGQIYRGLIHEGGAMIIHTIPGKLVVTWNASVRAIVDKWTDYGVSVEEFKEAVIDKGLSHAKTHGGHAYIIDSSEAEGNFSKPCQDVIASDIFPAFAESGIKYFITIKSKSALTNLSIQSYEAKIGPHGIQLVEAADVDGAVAWLKANA